MEINLCRPESFHENWSLIKICPSKYKSSNYTIEWWIVISIRHIIYSVINYTCIIGVIYYNNMCVTLLFDKSQRIYHKISILQTRHRYNVDGYKIVVKYRHQGRLYRNSIRYLVGRRCSTVGVFTLHILLYILCMSDYRTIYGFILVNVMFPLPCPLRPVRK